MATVTSAHGITVGYAEQGSGTPVVLLPGSAVDHTIFVPGGQFASFAQHFRVIALDWRGTGESSRDEAPYTAADLEADVLGVLDTLGIDRAHLVGMSQGSTIAQRIAAHHPDRVDRLVLYSTWGHTDSYLRGMFTFWEHLYRTTDPQVYGEATLWFLLSREFLNADPDAVQAIAKASFASETAATRHAQIQAARINAVHDNRDLLAKIGAPTLVLAGRQDRTIPAEYSEQVARTIPGAEIRVLEGPGASHALFLERADEVNDATLAFLRADN
ncbi:alpha/beta hydrolase [Rhodococcus ruber BKS 20-38]|uniref:Alpha/beta hydrolase n=1 Tax=Rhodococcus ruber BKS 20-38 TaxID=1278076 RepID=M2YY42_9NOCA|nr:alpha/beta hydrolase [Rhodococcus ruber]EME66915.1 alpha/beta hydrolase [Rhodococcus ruber BKS 20-38]